MSHQCIVQSHISYFTNDSYHCSTIILILLTINFNYLGEYKRLVPGYDNKTKQKVIKSDNYDDIDNEYGSENKLDDKSINFDGNYCDKIEAKNEQMKRLLHLQNLAGDAGDIPGTSRIMQNFILRPLYKQISPLLYLWTYLYNEFCIQIFTSKHLSFIFHFFLFFTSASKIFFKIFPLDILSQLYINAYVKIIKIFHKFFC